MDPNTSGMSEADTLTAPKTPGEAEAASPTQLPSSAEASGTMNAADGNSTEALHEASDALRSEDAARGGSVDRARGGQSNRFECTAIDSGAAKKTSGIEWRPKRLE